MAIEALTPREQQVVLQCMKAVAVLIEEWEMHSRLGIECTELQMLIGQWPAIDDSIQDSDGFLAINNSLNEICNGVNVHDWNSFFDSTPDEVRETYQNWLRLQRIHGGLR